MTKFYTKFKAFADVKLKVIQMTKFVLDKIEYIVGKEKNRTMMVLYRSPEYLAVKVCNEDKYQSSRPNE